VLCRLSSREHVRDGRRHLAIDVTPSGFAGHLFEAANLRAVLEVLGTVQARLNLKPDVGCKILAQFD
jgi:hypothetical protein